MNNEIYAVYSYDYDMACTMPMESVLYSTLGLANQRIEELFNEEKEYYEQCASEENSYGYEFYKLELSTDRRGRKRILGRYRKSDADKRPASDPYFKNLPDEDQYEFAYIEVCNLVEESDVCQNNSNPTT